MKTVMIDLDGTLLQKPDFDISIKDLDALENFQKKGNKIGIATGRNYQEVNYLIQNHKLDLDYIVGVNGMFTYHKEHGSKCLTLIENDKKKLIDFLESNKIQYEAQTDIERYFTSQEYIDWLDNSMGTTPTINSGVNLPISKIVVRKVFNDMDIIDIYNKLSELELNLNIILCNNSVIEIMNNNINKFSKIKETIDEEYYYAIGDSENDIEMLINAKVGFLMSHASDALKEHLRNKNIKYVDSVADAIEFIQKENCEQTRNIQ